MNRPPTNSVREILREVQRRLPAGQRFAQEAFTTDHGHTVQVKLNELAADAFYIFDEFTVCAFQEAVLDWASRHGNGRVTTSCPAFGEFQAQRHRFDHLAGKVEALRVLAVGTPERFVGRSTGIEIVNTNGGLLSRYRVTAKEGTPAALFICREVPARSPVSLRFLGFFTADTETVAEIADDVDAVLRGQALTLATFDRLQLLHQTTQRVARELESYSRRMELAIRRAQRRPDLLTPERFERIVRQSIAKMEQLKEIPRRALRTLGQGN